VIPKEFVTAVQQVLTEEVGRALPKILPKWGLGATAQSKLEPFCLSGELKGGSIRVFFS
jgi:hypothetical protein